jgi:hypothetical protein
VAGDAHHDDFEGVALKKKKKKGSFLFDYERKGRIGAK